MQNLQKIPTTIVTGFLGAGKTSLIKHVMQNAGGRKIALLINEFGDVGVDGEILKSCADENCPESAIIELPNGCICCTVADDFLPAMKKILAMGGIEHIIIETSGLALPKPLVKAFDWPEIRSSLTVDGVIAVVDTPAVFAGDFAEDLEAIDKQKAQIGIASSFEKGISQGRQDEVYDLIHKSKPDNGKNLNQMKRDHDNPLAEVYEDQLLCADMIILNKTDSLDAEKIAKVREDVLRETVRGVPIIEAAHGDVPPDILLGIKAAAESDLHNRPSHHEAEEEHDHDDFESFVIDIPEFIDISTLHDKIITAAQQCGVLRVKGYAKIEEKKLRYLVQAVGIRVSGNFDSKPVAQAGSLVVIGRKGIDKKRICEILLSECLAEI